MVHTIDVSKHHSEHAQQIVSGFRQGMYTRDIDFHVGDVSGWIDQQFTSRGLNSKEKEAEKTFLSHIILDLPGAHHHIEKAASALHVHGSLVVFNPNITQIMAVVRMVKEKYLPLQLDRVVELGPNMTGGREWDVRSVKPRARIQAEQEEAARKAQGSAGDLEIASNEAETGKHIHAQVRDPEEVEATTKSDAGWVIVCRPKVGYVVTGGGFVCHLKKMKW